MLNQVNYDGFTLTMMEGIIDYRKTTHKYGIEIPAIIEHGHIIDTENGNNFWRGTNATKMHNVGVAFEVLPEG